MMTMETKLFYSLTEDNQAENGECDASLSDKGLSIKAAGTPLLISYRDIIGIEVSDYTIAVSLSSGGTLKLSQLGYKYEDFARELSRLFNDSTLRDLLMDEPKERMRMRCEFSRETLSADGSSSAKKSVEGGCELRLYDTGLVFIPGKGSLIRMPLGEISAVDRRDLTMSVKSECDGEFIFSKLGREADPFRKALADSVGALDASTQGMLQETLPEAGYIQLRKAASLMRDGKAAKRSDLEFAPGLFAALERKVDPAGLRENYDHLSSLARKERMALGVKRGLMGEGSEYIWFLFPIYSADSRPGNAIAMEAASISDDPAEGGGRATYFFRLMGHDGYKARRGIEELDMAFDSFLGKINRCMIRVNFRREPIYLPDGSLMDPKYSRYRFALARIPELKELRSLFIGRVIHRSTDQWRKDVSDLLDFNANAKNDSERWQGSSDPEDRESGAGG